jgi:hypothetical protein
MVKTRSSFSSRASFTLVETLVAMAILIILILVVSKIVAFSLQLTDATGRSADSGIEAKQVLDRIGADVAGMVNRIDVDQVYYSGNESLNPGENDKMFFYSQQTGYFNTNGTAYYATNQSPVALVGYRINTSDNPSGLPALERLARGLTAGPDNSGNPPVNSGGPYTGPLQYLSFPAATSPTIYQAAVGGSITNVWGSAETATIAGAGSEGDVGSSGGNYDDGASPFYHIVGNDVFRFEVCFQIQNGTSSPVFSLYPGYTNSAPVYPASITNNLAMVVAIAVLDAKSRKLVPAASWSKMIAALPNPTTQNLATNGLMSVLWNNALQQSTFASKAGIPALAASHIKVYQRSYYLNMPKAQ